MENTTSTPETTNLSNPEKAFKLDDVLALREAQQAQYKTRLSVNHHGIYLIDDEAALQSEMNDSVRNYLDDHNIAQDSDRYGDYFNSLRALSYDTMSNSVWKYGEWQDKDNLVLKPRSSGIDTLHDTQEQLFGRRLDEVSNPDETTSSAETERNNEINQLTEAKQSAYVELIRTPFYKLKQRTEAKQAYEAALTAYTAKITDFATDSLSGLTGDERTAALAELAKATKERAGNDATAEQELFVRLGGKKAELLKKYSELSLSKKIGYGVLVGAGLAVAGGAAAAAAGGVGAGAAVAAGGIAAGRAARTYAAGISRLYRPGDQQSAEFSYDRPDMLTDKQASELASDYLASQSNNRVKSAERTRKLAIGMAIGATAVGGAGMIASHHADLVSHWQSSSFDAVKEKMGWGIDHHTATASTHFSDGAEYGSSPASTEPIAHPSYHGDVPEIRTSPGDISLVNEAAGSHNYLEGSAGNMKFSAEGLKDFDNWIDGKSVKSGDSVWKLSEQYLNARGNANPSVYQIDAVKDQVLEQFKAKGLVTGRGWLRAGDIIKVK